MLFATNAAAFAASGFWLSACFLAIGGSWDAFGFVSDPNYLPLNAFLFFVAGAGFASTIKIAIFLLLRRDHRVSLHKRLIMENPNKRAFGPKRVYHKIVRKAAYARYLAQNPGANDGSNAAEADAFYDRTKATPRFAAASPELKKVLDFVSDRNNWKPTLWDWQKLALLWLAKILSQNATFVLLTVAAARQSAFFGMPLPAAFLIWIGSVAIALLCAECIYEIENDCALIYFGLVLLDEELKRIHNPRFLFFPGRNAYHSNLTTLFYLVYSKCENANVIGENDPTCRQLTYEYKKLLLQDGRKRTRFLI